MDEDAGLRRVFHPAHRTAHSRRQSGFDIFAVLPSGEMYHVGTSTKASLWLVMPCETLLLAQRYLSNSGRRSILLYEPSNGLPSVGELGWWNAPEDLDALLERLQLSRDCQFAQWAARYLWEHCWD